MRIGVSVVMYRLVKFPFLLWKKEKEIIIIIVNPSVAVQVGISKVKRLKEKKVFLDTVQIGFFLSLSSDFLKRYDFRIVI